MVKRDAFSKATMRSIENNYKLTRSIITFLDILLALLIIVTANKIINTSFGKGALLFGFFMLLIVTLLKIFQKW